MHLSKSERVYKKKLFRHIKVKKKSKQKELTAIIVKSPIYKRGGFKQIYSSTKYGVVKLNEAIISITNAARSATKLLYCLAQFLKHQGIKDKGESKKWKIKWKKQ